MFTTMGMRTACSRAICSQAPALPDPGETRIVLYVQREDQPALLALRDMLRAAYRNQGTLDANASMAGA